MPEKEEDYEVMQERIMKANESILNDFYAELLKQGLTEKTALKHGNNLAFFGNDFLLNYESATLVEGIEHFPYFIGSWFIRKAMWSDETTVKDNIVAAKKFYTYLDGRGQIEERALQQLLDCIKEEKETWLETVRKYNNPDIDFEEVFH